MIFRSRAAPAASWLAILFMGVADADALSLRNAKAEAFLGDMRPGSVVVLSSAAGGPLSVENAGAEPVTIEASVEQSPPKKLKDGFDPLPDLGWVEINNRVREVDVGKSWSPDVRLKVPKDRRLEGGLYQFDFLFKGRSPGGGGGLTVRTAVTLAVGEKDVGEKDVGGARDGPTEGLTLSPKKARIEGIPIGARVPARSETFRALKLANPGDKPLTVRARAVRARPGETRLEDGWTPAPNPSWLKTGPPLTVPAGGVAQAAFELEIPRQRRYLGRSWAFTVAVDDDDGGRAWWTLYVRTAPE